MPFAKKLMDLIFKKHEEIQTNVIRDELLFTIHNLCIVVTDEKVTAMRLEEELLYHALHSSHVSCATKREIILKMETINNSQISLFKGILAELKNDCIKE